MIRLWTDPLMACSLGWQRGDFIPVPSNMHLSTEAGKQVWAVIKALQTAGVTLEAACRMAGANPWSSSTFVTNVLRFFKENVTNANMRRMAWQALRNAGPEAAKAAARLGFAEAAAVASSSSVIPILIVLAILGGGAYMYSNWGKPSSDPIKAGPRGANDGRKGGPATYTPAPTARGDKYFIYAVQTSGLSFYVGRPKDVEGRPARSFADGGTSSDPVAFTKLVDTPFENSNAAIDYLKTRISGARHDYWKGKIVTFGGKEYRTVHVGL
jgi:hypothetical protein